MQKILVLQGYCPWLKGSPLPPGPQVLALPPFISNDDPLALQGCSLQYNPEVLPTKFSTWRFVCRGHAAYEISSRGKFMNRTQMGCCQGLGGGPWELLFHGTGFPLAVLARDTGDGCTTGRLNHTFLNAWFYQVSISPNCFKTLWANYSCDSCFTDKEIDEHKNQATCPAPTIIVTHGNSHTVRTAEPQKVIQGHPFLWQLGNWSLLVKEPAPKSWRTVKFRASDQAGLHHLCEYYKSISKYNLMAPQAQESRVESGKTALLICLCRPPYPVTPQAVTSRI